MEKKKITSKQAVSIMILFILGSSMIFGGSNEAAQDSWLGVIVGVIMFIPIVFLYSRIMKLYPQKNIFDIFYLVFGKIGGVIFTFLLTLYAIHLSAVIIRNFTEFIQVQSLTSTPQFVVALAIGFICFWTLKYGLTLLGRGSVLIVPVLMISIAITIVLLIQDMNFDNIRPIGGQGLKTITKCSFDFLAFPFGELVLFMAVLQKLRSPEKIPKIYFKSVFISGIILTLIVLRNILVLGASTLDSIFFNSYAAVTVIDIADFITRIEVLVAGNFIVCGLVKICICLYAGAKGVSKMFNIKNYKSIIIPITFVSIAASGYMYNSTMEVFNYKSVYKYIAPFFQILIPLITWIFAEIKVKKQSKQELSLHAVQTSQAVSGQSVEFNA